jgi:hypothetical protein
MILSEDYLHELAEQALTRVDVRPDDALVLEGSIAEGFGNTSSDIDFLLVADSTAEMPTMPSILFVAGRRVEIRTRSVRQVTQQLETVAKAFGAGPRRIAKIDEDLLNRCQRFLRSFPLRRADLVDKIKDTLAYDAFAELMSTWWAEHARQSIRHAIALDELGAPREAVTWARSGLLQAAKSWAAGKGETYLEPKWLSMQLDRIGPDERADRYLKSTAGLDLSGCVELAADLGVSGAPRTPDRIIVDRVPKVTTWQIGDRVHVLRDRQDVFVLGAEAATAWRSVVFGRSLSDVLARATGTGIAEPGELLATFLRYGLLKLTWQGGGAIVPALPLAAPAGPVSPPPAAVRRPVAIGGAPASSPRAVDLMPVPARRFGSAGLALVWSNVLVENSIEDLTGALALGQWGVAELTARRALSSGLRALLSAHAVNPLPSDAEVAQRISLLPPAATEEIGASVSRLEDLSITDEAEGAAVRAELDTFIRVVRQATGADEFPSSFHSAETWQATLDLGYHWLRLGAYLDADIPIDEARDLLTSGGAQPHVVN